MINKLEFVETLHGSTKKINISNSIQQNPIIQEQEDPQEFKELENKIDISINKPKKPLSSYFFFVKTYGAESGEKHNLTELGEIWRQMPQDYKEVIDKLSSKKYVSLNLQDRERYQKEMEQWLLVQVENKDINQVEDEMETQTYFPISRIRLIMKEDESCKLPYRKEAYFYIQRAAVYQLSYYLKELFGKNLLNQCKSQADFNKRKTINEDDLYASVKEHDELEFLECLIQMTKEQEQQKELKPIIKKVQPPQDVKQTLFNYFQKKP